MELFFSPSILVALGTLVLLEVVLGIDNLLFIAILAEKLPPEKRDKARMIGLLLAMFMRLGLLCIISWVVSLTTPIFSIKGHAVSWRDVILVSGGFFLLFKATRELHERLESKPHEMTGTHEYAGFWVVVIQIVVLDAVFSLDAVITAVGMVEHLSVMMIAVVIAIGIMLLAAKPLAIFVNEHPTVVVLCLSFLLLIGLSLIAEGAGIHLPKAYLYAAIGFSVLIETFNQIATSNARKHQFKRSMRARTAEAVLRLLGSAAQPAMATAGAGGISANDDVTTHMGQEREEHPVFASEEVDMVGRILALSERTARSIMTYRGDTVYLDLENSIEELQNQLFQGTPDIVPVCRNGLDNLVGVAYAVDILSDIVQYKTIRPETLEEPIIVPETMRVNNLLNTLRGTTMHLVLVADEYGSIEGVVTLMDVFEAIAGDLPEKGEPLAIVPMGHNKWRMAGSIDVHYLEVFLDLPEIVSESNDYTSLAGFLLSQFGNIPVTGDITMCGDYIFTVVEVAGHRITLVDVEHVFTKKDG